MKPATSKAARADVMRSAGVRWSCKLLGRRCFCSSSLSYRRPTPRDLGLPRSTRDELARDVVIGIVACLAAIVPVHCVQVAAHASVLQLQNELPSHPLDRNGDRAASRTRRVMLLAPSWRSSSRRSARKSRFGCCCKAGWKNGKTSDSAGGERPSRSQATNDELTKRRCTITNDAGQSKSSSSRIADRHAVDGSAARGIGGLALWLVADS